MFKCFPATLTPDRQKVPLVKGWQSIATTDPAQLKQWQEVFRDRISFWGIPTGSSNDIIALDIDVKHDGFGTLQKLGVTLPDTLSQKTLSGGAHFIFRLPKDGRHYGNRAGLFGKESGVDIRGEGGWIAHYGLTDKPILDAPPWLIEAIGREKPAISPLASSMGVAPEIALGIIQGSISAIKNAAEGESNDTLNRESFRIGQLVASNSVSREYAEQILFAAAKERGKPDFEAKATIRSGLDGGGRSPLLCPFPAVEPVPPAFAPPAVPTPERWTPRYFTRADLVNWSKLKRPQLFEHWSTEDIHITTADGGTGKTTMKLYEAICLAIGAPFLGFQCKQKGKTLFITGEDTAEKLAASMGAIMRQMDILKDEAMVQTVLTSIVIKKDADLCLITKDKQNFLTINRDALRKVQEAVDDIKPKMIVFDPISSFWGSEAALNDMNKAVTKFMSELTEKSQACVEMINHMGKSSSASKDITQFAGRGGTGLPSNSRVSRAMRPVTEEEFQDLTGETLDDKQAAILCNVNKFTDGSPLLNKQFLIVREGYLFTRRALSPIKERELEKETSDGERIFQFIREARISGKYPTKSVVVGHFQQHNDPIPVARINRAIQFCQYSEFKGVRVKAVQHPDQMNKESALVLCDLEGTEL